MNLKIAHATFRTVFAALIFVAIGIQHDIHIGHEFSNINFFSYFTNLSNLAAAIVFALAGWRAFRKTPVTRNFDFIRGAVVVQMTLVGLVFNTLLRNVDLGSLLPWINVLLHMVAPAIVIADWLVEPPTFSLPKKSLWLWLLPPLVYVIYSFVRGYFVGWYAYPFFNPELVGGYIGVAMYCAGILAFLALIGVLVRWSGNRRKLLSN